MYTNLFLFKGQLNFFFQVLCISQQAHCQTSVNCSSSGAGRFPDPVDSTCKNYTYCIYVATSNSYVSYDYVCPGTSVFNPDSGLCTAPTNYACNVTANVCTEEAFIPNPAVTDCSSYIGCTLIDGDFIQTVYPCLQNTFYNPNSTLCESTYVCPTAVTAFECSAAGRFANNADASCKTYYLCVRDASGNYEQFTYTCPSTSVFNPTSRLCTTAYNCVGAG